MTNDETLQEQQIRLEYQVAKDFRVVAADSAVLNQFGDGVATTLKITFTRIDPIPIAETFKGKSDGASLRQTGPLEIETDFRKVQEVAVLMRPDQAYRLAGAVIASLSALSEDQRQRYRLPTLVQLPELG
jgi:hypothetical protein